jgi:hypothetical protein
MKVGGEYGYPISQQFESGLGAVLQVVLAAFGAKDEAEFAAMYPGHNIEQICIACESNPDTIKGRLVAAHGYMHTAGEKSKTPGKQRIRASFAPYRPVAA